MHINTRVLVVVTPVLMTANRTEHEDVHLHGVNHSLDKD